MNRNVEIKARANDFLNQYKIAETISDTKLEVLYQEDTFFIVNTGRLKLRKFNESNGELIFYKRSDTFQAKQSSYQIFPTDAPETLKKTLTMALGIIGVIQKTRHLFIYKQTRIHLDEVKNLGRFIELEYVLRPNEKIENGQNAVQNLIEKLKIQPEDLISYAYIDLLLSE